MKETRVVGDSGRVYKNVYGKSFLFFLSVLESPRKNGNQER